MTRFKYNPTPSEYVGMLCRHSGTSPASLARQLGMSWPDLGQTLDEHVHVASDGHFEQGILETRIWTAILGLEGQAIASLNEIRRELRRLRRAAP